MNPVVTKTIKGTESRPPVVAVMGHIDHGKSTLLDYIRNTNIVAKEAGGITQHISAYEVIHKNKDENKKITFLDTPGHEAFASMRERGSLIADIAILMVSAEEGVKTQTKEALQAIENAGIPYIIAINKIDRPNANADRTKQSLAENNILVESYGGKIPSVNISAKTGEGIPELLDLILLVTELEELTGTKIMPATGFVLETKHDKRIGTTVTLIVKDGTLKQGDYIVAGQTLAKVKRLENFLGQAVNEISFSAPVKVFGFTEAPNGSPAFITFTDKKEAEQYHEEILTKKTEVAKDFMEALENQIIIPLILKADTIGTLEAVQREVAKLDTENVRLKTVQSGIGNITESDMRVLTGSTNAIAIGFNVEADHSALDLAERHNLTIATFNIIYKLSEWLVLEIEKRRPRITSEKMLGRIKILKLFNETKNKFVLGGRLEEGRITKQTNCKIIRREAIIGQGRIVGLQQNKSEVSEITDGEFGMLVEAKISPAPGDYLETFELVSE